MYPLKMLLVVFVCASWPAIAGPLEDGAAAAAKGDYATALRMLGPLADQGNGVAQGILGAMYEHGQGVPQDYVAAVNWYWKAAERGFVPAQHALGASYFKGQGVPKDYSKAVTWTRKAADRDFAPAQYNLGLMYLGGHGVPQDYVQAHMWLNLAASRSYNNAAEFRDMVTTNMTPAQIAEAQKLAREWKPKPKR